eukprot:g17908.t1
MGMNVAPAPMPIFRFGENLAADSGGHLRGAYDRLNTLLSRPHAISEDCFAVELLALLMQQFQELTMEQEIRVERLDAHAHGFYLAKNADKVRAHEIAVPSPEDYRAQMRKLQVNATGTATRKANRKYRNHAAYVRSFKNSIKAGEAQDPPPGERYVKLRT